MAIILAGIDLTGGALAALSGVMTVASLQWWGVPPWAAVSLGISIGPIPLPVIYMLIFLIADYFLLNKTKVGRHIYAVGGNETAARFSGINVRKIKILVWASSGALAGFCGVVLAARLASGQPATGEGYETDAIAAAVLGGTSFFGGTGTVGGLLIGVLIIGVLIIGLISNGLNLMHVNSYWQYVLKGIIIIAAVYMDMIKQRRQNTAK